MTFPNRLCPSLDARSQRPAARPLHSAVCLWTANQELQSVRTHSKSNTSHRCLLFPRNYRFKVLCFVTFVQFVDGEKFLDSLINQGKHCQCPVVGGARVVFQAFNIRVCEVKLFHILPTPFYIQIRAQSCPLLINSTNGYFYFYLLTVCLSHNDASHKDDRCKHEHLGYSCIK